MNLPRLFRTVRYLKPGQIAYRLYWPVKPRRVGNSPAVALRSTARDWCRPPSREAEMTGSQQFRILNQEIDVVDAAAWNDPARDKLLLYHLHYMDDLTAADAELRANWHRQLIDQWIDENPPLGGNGWEPYPLSLRIVNWIKWALAGNELAPKQLESLWIQSRVLNQSIEYHLQANHLLANVKALLFAGVFFSGDEPNSWQRKATRILEAQVREQVLPDGGHIERSPMYQAVLIEDFLDIVNLSNAYGLNCPKGVPGAAAKMIEWLDYMTHPDGEPAYFNDTVAGNTATLSELRAYAARLGVDVPAKSNSGHRALASSGYHRFDQDGMALIVDAGSVGPDFQPGHAHCDCLSFELSTGTRRVFVNTGVSTYNDSPLRHAERSTAAHNTVSLPGEEQSEIWGAFRVGRRARPLDVETGADFVSAAHDGYKRLGTMHRRRFEIQPGVLTIRDQLEARRPVGGVAYFHVHPDFTPAIDGDQVELEGVRMSFERGGKVDLVPYQYCLGFNDRRDAVKVAVTFEAALTTRIRYEDSLHIR